MSEPYVFDTVSVEAFVHESAVVLVSGSLCSNFALYFEPVTETVPMEASDHAMGSAVQSAFARCRLGVTDSPVKADDFAHSLGAKSWTDLKKRMWRASLGRSARETSVDIRNTIPKGRNGAFGSCHRVVDLHDTQALGQALWDALRTTE